MKLQSQAVVRMLDVLSLPFVYPAAFLLKAVRGIGVSRMPLCKNALMQVGVFPIRDHYYEPLFDYRNHSRSDVSDRSLPGIDLNVAGQLEFLSQLSFAAELTPLPLDKTSELEFYLNNGLFESGDAEFWYQLIRRVKPSRIIEIGSGNSTLMAIKAIRKNTECDPKYTCKHVCIEPYEMPWLEKTGVTIIRKKVEDIGVSFFSELGENDILFIDSTHIIRPGGDVLFEFLEVLPSLNKGVIVHIHDIFTPRHYTKGLAEESLFFWNEQYLLEGFLCGNKEWKIIGALNYLVHNHFAELKQVAPFITSKSEPGSFYMKKVG